MARSLWCSRKWQTKTHFIVNNVDALRKLCQYSRGGLSVSGTIDIKRRRLILIGSVDSDMLRAVCVAFDAFEGASRKRPIRIILSSDGGESYISLGIYDRIKASPCKVTIECLGEIMSAGTVILQAAYKRLLHSNTRFMIHYGTTSIREDSNAKDAISQIQFEQYFDNPLLEDIYMSRVGKRLTRDKLREYLSSDSFFTARRAVELGLADEVIKQ